MSTSAYDIIICRDGINKDGIYVSLSSLLTIFSPLLCHLYTCLLFLYALLLSFISGSSLGLLLLMFSSEIWNLAREQGLLVVVCFGDVIVFILSNVRLQYYSVYNWISQNKRSSLILSTKCIRIYN